LGPVPLEVLHHHSGHWAIWLLVATLTVTPLREAVGINLISWRKALGLSVFAWALVHTVLWVLDRPSVGEALAEVAKRPHIAVGMAALMGLVVLAYTSRMPVRRRMGPLRWRGVHRWIYGIAMLVVVHHVMSLKTLWQGTWAFQLVCVAFLLGWRFWRVWGPYRIKKG
jgi:sulfoxide reductase heme-binding subunit YedZ